MPRTNTIVGSFAAGEVSPRLLGRAETQLYKSGAKTLRNCLSDSRGPAYSRLGYTHNTRVQNQANVKMAAFPVTQSIGFICAFFDQALKIITDNRRTFGPNLVRNGFFKSLSGWQDMSVNGVVTFKNAGVSFEPGIAVGNTAEIQSVINLSDPAATYKLQFVGDFRGTTADEAVVVSIGTTPGGTDIFTGDYYNGTKYGEYQIVAPGVNTLYCSVKAKDWSNNPATSTESRLVNITCRKAIAALGTTDIVTPYLAADIDELYIKMVPGLNKAFIVHNNYAPAELIYDVVLDSWTYQAIVFTSAPAYWVAGNYPACVEFHQGRAWWGGYPKNPETFDASKSAVYNDFTVSAPPVDDDALSFTLSQKGLIKWIVSGKDLLVGTEANEFVISAANELIVHNDIQATLQSAHGSSNIDPVLAGTDCVFVPIDKRRVRAMTYEWNDNGWNAEDISYTGEHIFSVPVKQLSLSKNPDTIFWLVMSNGLMASCSYQSKNSQDKINGWHVQETDGSFVDSTVLDFNGTSVLWVAVQLIVNGVSEIHIGSIYTADEMYKNRLDNATRVYSAVATDTINNLDYLEGKYVTVIRDGSVHRNILVTGGSITLPLTGYVFDIGLGFRATIQSLPLRFYTSDSAEFHAMKRHNKVFVSLLDSAMPIINGDRPADRSPFTVLNSVQPYESKLVQVANVGWSRDAVITIEQDLPLPLTVVFIAGEAAVEQL